MNKNDIRKRLLVILGLLLLLAGATFYYSNKSQNGERQSTIETEGENWTGKRKTKKKQAPQESIAIPGFDSIELKENEVAQKVNFYNPKENNCYFKLKLILDDGTLLWESKYIEPNKGVYDIELLKALPKGEHNAILKYETFTMDKSLEPLNGSEIGMKVFVV